MTDKLIELARLVDRVIAGDFKEDPEEIADIFLEGLENKDDLVRAKALSGLIALIKVRDLKPKLPAIAKAIMNFKVLEAYGLRKDALVAFEEISEQIEDKSTLSFARDNLTRFLKDQRMEIRSRCAKLLWSIGESGDVFALVQSLINDVNIQVQQEVIETLSKIDSDAAAKRILEEITKFNRAKENASMYKTNWHGVVKVMGEQLQSGNEWVIRPLQAIAENSEFEGSPALAAREFLSG